MFTGLIKDMGSVVSIKSNGEGKEFVIRAPKIGKDIQVDDSVSTNGVCLTATEIKDMTFKVQAVHVTLEKSNLGKIKPGDKVNLELALRPMDRMGGHFVQGHVNGIGQIKSLKQRGKNWEISISPPKELFRYIISEGSIALDGISLTVSNVQEPVFTVSIIPHTYEMTILHSKKIGDSVNIEVDMMAKYLENFLKHDKQKSSFEQMVKKNA